MSLNLFVGRTSELQRYQLFLTRESPWILIIRGLGGSGKSTLLSEFEKQTPRDTCVVTLDFAQEALREDDLTLLQEVSEQVKSYCDPKRTGELRRSIANGRHEIGKRVAGGNATIGEIKQSITAGSDADVHEADLTIEVGETIQETRRQMREAAREKFYAQMETFRLKRLVIMFDTCEWLSEETALAEAARWVASAKATEEGLLRKLKSEEDEEEEEEEEEEEHPIKHLHEEIEEGEEVEEEVKEGVHKEGIGEGEKIIGKGVEEVGEGIRKIGRAVSGEMRGEGEEIRRAGAHVEREDEEEAYSEEKAHSEEKAYSLEATLKRPAVSLAPTEAIAEEITPAQDTVQSVEEAIAMEETPHSGEAPLVVEEPPTAEAEAARRAVTELIKELRTRMQNLGKSCYLVMASRMPLQLEGINDLEIAQWTLKMLDRAEVNQYLEEMEVKDPAIQDYIYNITYGHPHSIATINDIWEENWDRPLSAADLPKLKGLFYERAIQDIVDSDILKRLLKSPLDALTRYGVLLRRFNLPLLQTVFPEWLPEPEASNRFNQLIRYPHVESRGDSYYAFHELVRDILAYYVRVSEPEKWRLYNQRAFDYLTQISPNSPDCYYYLLAYDEEQGMIRWRQAVQEARNRRSGEDLGALFEVVNDKALNLTPLALVEVEQESKVKVVEGPATSTPGMTNALALVIGINNYQSSSFPNLRYAVNDARAIFDILVDPNYCGYATNNVQLLLDEQATREGVLQALTDLAQRTNQDSSVLIYFSGHGRRSIDGSYLALVNSTEDISTHISSTEFSILDAIPVRRILVVIDSNAFDSGLQEKPGRVIMAAARENESSYENATLEQGHGLLTYYLLAGLRGEAASEDGFIRVFDLFEYVQPQVTFQRKEQHPILKFDPEDNFPIALYQGGRQGTVIKDSDGFRYDVYVSYALSDADWVWKTLVPHLVKSELRIAISNDVEQPGVSRVVNAERGITQAKRTLIVLSESYLADHAVAFESVLKRTISIQESEIRLLSVLIAPLNVVTLPQWLRGTLLDFSNQDLNTPLLERLVQMLRKPRLSVLNYEIYITERTRDFTGRDWVFQAINDWLSDTDGPRFFLLSGEPGSGKTAIASRLSQFAQGVVPPPYGLTNLTPYFLSGIHFCSARDMRWVNPHVFVESLATVLAERYPHYAKALAERSGDRQIRIKVNQQVQKVEGQIVDVVIERLDVSGVSPEYAFNRTIREPLEDIFRDGFDQQVIILVDALDEALSSTGPINIVSLLSGTNFLPTGVRFLVTTRPAIEVLHQFQHLQLEEVNLTSNEGLNRSLVDVREYINYRLQTFTGRQRSELAEQIAEAAEGNFLYALFVLDDVLSNRVQVGNHIELSLPKSLSDIYRQFIEQKLGRTFELWRERYRSFLGVLAVACGDGLVLSQLAGIFGITPSQANSLLQDCAQFLISSGSDGPFRIYHPSFRDFLLGDEEYRFDPAEANQAIVNYFLNAYADNWLNCKDDYALRYTPTHIVEAAQYTDEINTRQKLMDTLANLLKNLDFVRARSVRGVDAVLTDVQIEFLLAMLHDPDRDVRQAAVEVLGQQGERVPIEPLMNALYDPDRDVRRAAIEALGQQRGRVPIEVLLPALQDESAPVRRAAVAALGEQGERMPIEMLLPALQDESASVRRAAVEVLGQQGERVLIEALVPLLQDPDRSVRRAVVEVLGGQGERVPIEVLVPLLQDPNEDVRRAVVEVLGGQGERVPIEPLMNALHDPDRDVRRAAIKVLGQQGERIDAVWKEIQGVIGTIEESDERAEALRALATALAQNQQWSEAERVISTIEEVIERARALREFGTVLAQAQRWSEAERVIDAIGDSNERAGALRDLGVALAQAQQWVRAEVVIRSIEQSDERLEALQVLGTALDLAGYRERAEAVQMEVEAGKRELRATTSSPINRDEALARMEFVRGDLLELHVDVLVHAVGLDLARGGTLGSQLVGRVGAELAEQLQSHQRLRPAEAIVTSAGSLPARYLIHVAIEDSQARHSIDSVTRGASAAMEKAESLGDVRTIAFPALGTGAAGINAPELAVEILKAITSHLEQGSQLEKVIFAFIDDDYYQAYVDAYRSMGGRIEVVPQAFNTYSLTLSFPRDQIMVGERMSLRVLLQPASVSSRDNVVKVPTNVVEVYCSVSAEGLRVFGPALAAIPIDPRTSELAPANFELEAHLHGLRSFTVELFIEDPQSGRLSIFQTISQVIVEPPTAGEERPPFLPALEVRVAPLPDFVLEVDADPTGPTLRSHHLTYRLTSRLPFLPLEHRKVGEVVLRETDLARIKAMIRQAEREATSNQPEDSYEHMLSMGTYLFDRLFPADSAKDFREMYWKVADRLTTWLVVEDGVVEDGVSWLPWELVVPYRAGDMASPHFLGERYQLSRWVDGLGPSLHLYNEIPLGEVALAHYKIIEQGQEDQDEELQGWRRLLNADPAYGIRQVVKPETPVFGLHLLRYANQTITQDITPRDGPAIAHSPEEEMSQVRLDLWFKRPVVTLGILTQANGDLTNADGDDWPLPERVRTFLRNGASAVVGPWWPTSEDADQVFWPTFYELLARRVPLGEAVWRARLTVHHLLPHRLDWLAYALFGDPRARPYWPQPSEGYTALECINPNDPLRPNKTYYFRVSIRNRPPAWHEDRLILAEKLPQKPRAIFLAPGLQLAASEPIEMAPFGRTMVQATVGMKAPEVGVYQLTVRLLDGEERLQSLRLKLVVGETDIAREELN